MIYTSGSTGRPKGVSVPHRALRNLIALVIRDYALGPGVRVAAHSSFSFDASVMDIYPTLAAGGELHILEEAIRKDLPAIRDYLVRNRIQGMVLSTQIGMALLNAWPELPLEWIALGGEKLLPVAKTKAKLFNCYGPTEFCVESSNHVVAAEKDGGDIPIGRAVANTWSFIVDRAGQALPPGVPGEIALAGPQLADGYWRQPEKTARAFIATPDPLRRATGCDRMYLTGDLGRYNADGEIEYLGRIDTQVKLRGFRIEIGEIESVAKSFPGVGAVAVEVREVGGAKHLVLYYENADAHERVPPEAAEGLREFLASRLTAYMVPDYFVAMESLPVTPNGKIDRKALPSPRTGGAAREYVEPAEGAEKLIAEAWGKVLKHERYGATDDFFDVGGTSISAIEAVIELQKAGLDVKYGDLFKYKTPRALAMALGKGNGPETADEAGTEDVFAGYDYGPIAEKLSACRTDLCDGFELRPLGRTLLTGATGYLGMHILRYLLEKTDSEVTVLVRSRGGAGPARRIDSQYVYYFGGRLPEKFRARLAFLEGEITGKIEDGGRPFDTVLNCAALVKHYVADDAMDRINVGGVENLIDYCSRTGALLVQTSTYSVGGMIRADSGAKLTEQALYIGQRTDNEYVRTKFLAERAVLAAVAEGRLKAKIMRLGNLMGRESDGEFQMNVGANAFVNSLKSYHALGAYPLEDLARGLEMSPIDRVAEAVCLLSAAPEDMIVFHPYNRYELDMGAVVAAMNARGLEVKTVGGADFAARVDALRNDPGRAAELQGILHYAGHLLGKFKIAPTENLRTTTVLYRLGFRWRPADDRYLERFLDLLVGIGAFGV